MQNVETLDGEWQLGTPSRAPPSPTASCRWMLPSDSWSCWGVPRLRPQVGGECFIPSFSLLETNLLLGVTAPSLKGREHAWF